MSGPAWTPEMQGDLPARRCRSSRPSRRERERAPVAGERARAVAEVGVRRAACRAEQVAVDRAGRPGACRRTRCSCRRRSCRYTGRCVRDPEDHRVAGPVTALTMLVQWKSTSSASPVAVRIRERRRHPRSRVGDVGEDRRHRRLAPRDRGERERESDCERAPRSSTRLFLIPVSPLPSLGCERAASESPSIDRALGIASSLARWGRRYQRVRAPWRVAAHLAGSRRVATPRHVARQARRGPPRSPAGTRTSGSRPARSTCGRRLLRRGRSSHR